MPPYTNSRSHQQESNVPTSKAGSSALQEFEGAKAEFPDALANNELIYRVTNTLKKYGYGKTTLLATSLCCDEVNRALENDFEKHYGSHFNMGGLAGFAFGGVTSFTAMAHHIPDDGSCLIVYGPHIGIDLDNNVGRINRRFQRISTSCCGSADAAACYVASVRNGADEMVMPDQCIDIQQHFVGQMLLPHGERLEKAANFRKELAMALYDENHKMMTSIVRKACGEVHGNGKITLLGGIQINTPKGYSDEFMPLNFELRDNTGAVLQDLMSEIQSKKSSYYFKSASLNTTTMREINSMVSHHSCPNLAEIPALNIRKEQNLVSASSERRHSITWNPYQKIPVPRKIQAISENEHEWV